MIYFVYYFIIDPFLTGTLGPTNDQLPTSVASLLSWLERRTGIARSRVQTREVLHFAVYSTQLYKNWVHNCENHGSLAFIPAVQYSRTSIIRISRLSGLFLWSQFGHEYFLVKIRSHVLFKTTALKGAVKCEGFCSQRAKAAPALVVSNEEHLNEF